MSWFTFSLSKQVPVDQVDILLNIQGIDDSNESWSEEYNALFKKLNLDLPVFYFTVRPNYSYDVRNKELDVYEKKFISDLSERKYSKSFITELVNLINQAPTMTRKKLLSSIGLIKLKEKISLLDDDLSVELNEAILNQINDGFSHKITWHYPIIAYNGLQNQYHKWIVNVLKGDFGISLLDTRPVTDKMWEAMKWSVLVLMLNIFFAILFAFPIGVYNGMNPNSAFDNVSNNVLFTFFAIPKFWLATLFIIFFTTAEYGTWTNIFPSAGMWYPSGTQSFFSMLMESWHKLILPLIIQVIPDIAYLSRLIRSNVQEESNKEYIKTALSKGMSIKKITTKHVLPNSLIPTITLLVGTIPGAIASALVIEVIFNIPGIGRLMFESIQFADWAMVYPIVLVISVFSIALFLIGDILMALLNPKIKLG